jgi:Tfp pilus assembly protein PilP
MSPAPCSLILSKDDMKQMNFRLVHFFIVCAAFMACSCGYDELPTHIVAKTPAPAAASAEASAYKKKEPVRYVYKGDKFRDPFIPLVGESSYASTPLSEEAAVPNLGSLSLKGIFDDGKAKMALINGGGINYILKGSRLFDNRQRLVRGITGVIKKDGVIMIAPDKTTKELKLKSK